MNSFWDYILIHLSRGTFAWNIIQTFFLTVMWRRTTAHKKETAFESRWRCCLSIFVIQPSACALKRPFWNLHIWSSSNYCAQGIQYLSAYDTSVGWDTDSVGVFFPDNQIWWRPGNLWFWKRSSLLDKTKTRWNLARTCVTLWFARSRITLPGSGSG